MKAFRTYMDLIFKLISFKNHNPEYAKQNWKGITNTCRWRDYRCNRCRFKYLGGEWQKKEKKQNAYKVYYRR